MTRVGHHCPVPHCHEHVAGRDPFCPACMGKVSREAVDMLRQYRDWRENNPMDESLRRRHAALYERAISEARNPKPRFLR